MNNIRITIATCSVVGLYSLGRVIWKQFQKYKLRFVTKPDSSVAGADLPQELWLDIMENYLETIDIKHDLKSALNIALVDKTASQLVEKWFAGKIKPQQRYDPTQSRLSPKLCFFMKAKSEEAGLWLFSTESKPIYGPWMENNPLKAPENFFKFIALIMRDPKWLKCYLTSGRAMKRVRWNKQNTKRMSPLLSVFRIIIMSPFLDYLLNKFTSGEFALPNLLQLNIFEWRTDPFAMLMPMLMLMASHTLEANFHDLTYLRLALFAVLAGFHYGALAAVLPLFLTIMMTAEPFIDLRSSRKAMDFIHSAALIGGIASAIFFPATAYGLACLIYSIYDGIMFNRNLGKISYRRNFLLAVAIFFSGILWLIK